MTPEVTVVSQVFEYSAKAGVAVAYLFIMFLLYKAFDVFKLFVEFHFTHVKKLEDQLAENEKTSHTTAQQLTQIIGALNNTIQLLNQAVLQVLDDFKSLHSAVAEIKQTTANCNKGRDK